MRLLLAVLILALYLTNAISGNMALLLLFFAIVFALTSYISFCPIYQIFGINTCKAKEQK
ncbi:MAG: DUF2892 domain-containing protein [Candidatus Parvibacillus calidus]|nr:MAG: DUF2892 domain-containing protein [Candidatus Parvibacillus calidus]